VRESVNLHLAQFETPPDAPNSFHGHVTGFRASTGVKGLLTEKLVGHAYLGYKDMSDIKVTRRSIQLDGDVYGDLGLTYNFSKRWGATGNVLVTEANTRYVVGVRAYF
jgi:hypothetical protein